MPAKTPLTGDNIDAPAACAVPFRPYCGSVVTRMRNVSEYMLVLALCLVYFPIIVNACLSCEDIARQDVRWCADGDFLRNFCVLYFQRAACSIFQTCILNCTKAT